MPQPTKTRADRLALLLTGALAAALVGCDEELDLSPRAPEPAASPEPQLAEAEEPRDDSLEGCVDRLTRETPRSARNTLDATGYDTFFEDACHMHMAEAERSAVMCAEIHARLVRRACEMRVAIAASEPALCPNTPSGREPLCVALATRDASLCRAAPLLEQEACASLLGDPASCSRSIAPELCEAIVARHAAQLPPTEEPQPGAERAHPRANREAVELVASFTSVTREGTEEELLRDATFPSFDRGGRIFVERGQLVLELSDPVGAAALTRMGRGSISIRVPLAADGEEGAPFEARVGPTGASVEAIQSSVGSVRATEGSVSITRWSRELGGAVEGTFRATGSSGVGRVRVEGRFRSFLRDVSLEPPRGVGPSDDPRASD